MHWSLPCCTWSCFLINMQSGWQLTCWPFDMTVDFWLKGSHSANFRMSLWSLLAYYPESIVVSIFATVTSKQLILWRVSWLAPFQSSSRASASYQRSLARRMWRCQCVKELHCKLCFMFAIRIEYVLSHFVYKVIKKRSSWLNCSLRGDEAVLCTASLV